MAGAGKWISARIINNIANTNPYSSKPKSFHVSTRAAKFDNDSKRNDIPLISKRGGQKSSRSLVTVSTADGKWQGNWNLDYVFSLQQLQLQDLSEDDNDKVNQDSQVLVRLCIHKQLQLQDLSEDDNDKVNQDSQVLVRLCIHKQLQLQDLSEDDNDKVNQDSQVLVRLCIHKHAGFGLSVDGRITTSFTRKCSNCTSPYCREIDTNFNVWVLPLTKNKDSPNELPEIGGDDPSVIYVKPGFEADLDSLIQDTIRLATSVEETCSESCEKSEPKLLHLGTRNVASIDRRWSRLLDLRNANTI